MTNYIIRRMAYLLVVIFGASAIVFLLMRAVPGDPAALLVGEYAGPEQMAELRAQLGLDKPLPQQYVSWLADLLRGNFGRSFRNKEYIAAEIMARLPATVELAIASMIIGVSLGLFLGVVAAARHMSWVDNLVMMISMIGVALPVFWTGLLLILVFSVALNWLPVGGQVDVTLSSTGPTGMLVLDALLSGRWDLLRNALAHLVLPAVTLSWYPLASVACVTRSSMLEVLRQDFIRAARARGLSRQVVVYRHALRNALIPVITVVGISVGPLVSGAVLTETVFSWPGLGRYLVLSINGRDFPAVQAMVFLSAFAFAAVNLLVDLAYAWSDPRIRLEG